MAEQVEVIIEDAQTTSSRGSSGSRHAKDPELHEAKIGFLGAGKMTEMITTGLMRHANITPENIHIVAPSSKNLKKFKEMGCHVSKRNIDVFGKYACDIVFLACHGSVIAEAYSHGGTRPHPITTNYIPNLKKPLHILSLINGWSLEDVKKVLLNPENPKKYQLEMHRISMNCTTAYGQGLCAVDCDPESKHLSALVRSLLASIASIDHVPEAQMDAVCALMSSGLAFSLYYIQALADGMFKMGLQRPIAMRTSSKVMESAALAVNETGKNPNELRDSMCAPGGAAIYGLHILDKAEVASGITAGVDTAFKRGNELAGK